MAEIVNNVNDIGTAQNVKDIASDEGLGDTTTTIIRTTNTVQRSDSTSSGDTQQPSSAEALSIAPLGQEEHTAARRVAGGLADGNNVSQTIVCREWKAELANNSKEPLYTSIPEKDAVCWCIKDFSAFRAAAKASQIPPLVSPEFGRGCRLRLCLYDKKGRICGTVELPILKASRDGVAHFRISVVRPDLKPITIRKVEMRISSTSSSDKKLIAQQRASPIFYLTSRHYMGRPKPHQLVTSDCLRLRVEFEYFPFDAPAFHGVGRLFSDPGSAADPPMVPSSDRLELLNDIRNFCTEDPSQNVEIRRDDTIVYACRFLLCARSKRFREIFGNGTTIVSARGSPTRFGRGGTPSAAGPVSAVTVQDISAEALKQMLEYIHSCTCRLLDEQNADILKLLELFEASDIYGVESLTRRLMEDLSRRMNSENFMYMFEVAETCKVADFKRLCTEFMDSLPGSQVASLIRASAAAPSPRLP